MWSPVNTALVLNDHARVTASMSWGCAGCERADHQRRTIQRRQRWPPLLVLARRQDCENRLPLRNPIGHAEMASKFSCRLRKPGEVFRVQHVVSVNTMQSTNDRCVVFQPGAMPMWSMWRWVAHTATTHCHCRPSHLIRKRPPPSNQPHKPTMRERFRAPTKALRDATR